MLKKKAKSPIFWTDSFEKCKADLQKAPLLAYSDPEGEISLDCDTSDHGTGLYFTNDSAELGKRLDSTQRHSTKLRASTLRMIGNFRLSRVAYVTSSNYLKAGNLPYVQTTNLWCS